MIEVLRIQEVNKQIADEAVNLKNLKLKMKAIKHKTLNFKNEASHLHHDSVILGGGYYMFENDDEESSEASSKTDIATTSNQRVKFKSPPVSPLATPSETSRTSITSKDGSNRKVARLFKDILKQIVLKMRKMSRNYRLILTEMREESKTLKASLTPELIDSTQDM